MNIYLKDNTVLVDITDPFLDTGAKYQDKPEKINWKEIDVDTKYSKIEADSLKVTIPYSVFFEMAKLWNNQFNNIEPLQVKKTVLGLMSLASVIEEEKKTDDKKAIENELKETYEIVKKKPLEIIFNKIELYNCNYYLYMHPKSSMVVDVSLVPEDIFNKIDPDTLDKSFYLAVKMPISNLQDGINDDKAAVPKKVFHVEDFILPLVKKEISVKKGAVIALKSYFLANELTPSGISSKNVLSKYKKLSAFVLGSQNETYVYKAWGSNNLIVATEIIAKKLLPHSMQYGAVIKKTYIYSKIFFPVFLEFVDNEFLLYYACRDSNKRSRYGFFSEDYLGASEDKDKPIYKDFNSFFVYDFTNNLNVFPINVNELNYPDFSSSSASASASSSASASGSGSGGGSN